VHEASVMGVGCGDAASAHEAINAHLEMTLRALLSA
jgi:hypothetical protein